MTPASSAAAASYKPLPPRREPPAPLLCQRRPVTRPRAVWPCPVRSRRDCAAAPDKVTIDLRSTLVIKLLHVLQNYSRLRTGGGIIDRCGGKAKARLAATAGRPSVHRPGVCDRHAPPEGSPMLGLRCRSGLRGLLASSPTAVVIPAVSSLPLRAGGAARHLAVLMQTTPNPSSRQFSPGDGEPVLQTPGTSARPLSTVPRRPALTAHVRCRRPLTSRVELMDATLKMTKFVLKPMGVIQARRWTTAAPTRRRNLPSRPSSLLSSPAA